MQQTLAISQTHRAMVVDAAQKVAHAQAALDGLYTIILAGHDITHARVHAMTEEGLVVETPGLTPVEEGA